MTRNELIDEIIAEAYKVECETDEEAEAFFRKCLIRMSDASMDAVMPEIKAFPQYESDMYDDGYARACEDAQANLKEWTNI